MDKIAFVVLWLLIFSTAWEEMAEVPGVGRISRLIGMMAFLVGLVAVLAARRFRPPALFHGAIALFVCWSAATVYWSIDPESSVRMSFTYAQLLLLVWLIWEFAPDERRQRGLLQAYVLGAYLSAGLTIALFATSSMPLGRYAASGYNANDLGFTLVLALPMAWYLALVDARGPMAWLNRLYLPIGTLAVFLTGSRGAAIPAAVALTLIPWTLTRPPPRVRLVLAGLIIGSVFFLHAFVPPAAVERLSTIPLEIRGGSFSSRAEIWHAGWEVLQRHPLAGRGAGAYAEAVAPHLGIARSAHQSFLAVLVGQGLIGFTLFMAVFATALLPILRLPPLERKFWAVLTLTLVIGMMPRTWDYRKPTWLVLGVLTAHAATLAGTAGGRRARGHEPEPAWVYPGG